MLSEKALAALKLHDEGYNCAQAVLSVFADDWGISPAAACKISSCFGGGMRMGATCGALTGALMALGLAKGFSEYSPEAKATTEYHTSLLIHSWIEQFGVTDCREILGVDVRDPKARQKAKEQGVFAAHCPNCISSAVMLLEGML